ncbi:MAG: hypothetical protein ABR564_02330, partial [Candidatus Dormibacteria bacterium]
MSVATESPELIELLGHGTIGETWVARLPDGSLLAEKHVRCGDAAVRNQLLRRLETVRRVDVPGLATVRTVRRQGDDV